MSLTLGANASSVAGLFKRHNQYELSQYSLVSVVSKNATELFHDLTCGTGAMAVLGYVTQFYNASFVPGVKVSTSHLAIHTSELRLVDMSDAESAHQVVAFYRQMADVVRNPENRSALSQLVVILGLLKRWRYVYRGGQYYELADNVFPYASMQYRPTPFGLYVANIEGIRADVWINSLP